MAGVIVKPRSRILHGHDWIFTSEILKVYGDPPDGSVVAIKDGRDRFLGSGTFNRRSHLPVRRFSRHRQKLDREFFLKRVERAWELRVRNGFADRPCRLVWSESDGLPGVIVDRYGPSAVLQTLTLAMDLHKEMLAGVLMEVFGVEGVVERNDASSRRSEGMEDQVGLLAGREIRSHGFPVAGVTFEADLWQGQKTGFYLDQLPAYERVAALAGGRRVLDCFSNQGGFALTCARAGAASVVAVESGAEAVARLEANAAANQLSLKIERQDVFAYLRQQERGAQNFDLIILDPPSFAKGKTNTGAALKGYQELHLRAARLLAPGGLLATFSCSHHVSATEFLQTAADGARDAGKSFRLCRRFEQPADHPVLLHLPESEYLKGALLELAP